MPIRNYYLKDKSLKVDLLGGSTEGRVRVPGASHQVHFQKVPSSSPASCHKGAHPLTLLPTLSLIVIIIMCLMIL